MILCTSSKDLPRNGRPFHSRTWSPDAVDLVDYCFQIWIEILITFLDLAVGVDDTTGRDLRHESADFTAFTVGHFQSAHHSHSQSVVFKTQK